MQKTGEENLKYGTRFHRVVKLCKAILENVCAGKIERFPTGLERNDGII